MDLQIKLHFLQYSNKTFFAIARLKPIGYLYPPQWLKSTTRYQNAIMSRKQSLWCFYMRT